MIIKIVRILMIVLSVTILSSCWDIKKLDELAYVVAVGLDNAEGGKVRITYLIVNPEYNTQIQGSTSTEAFRVFSLISDDIFISRKIANTIISKDISFVLLQQLTISEKFAKSDDFIRWMYDMTKEKDIRKNININVIQETAYDYLNNFKPKIENKPYKYFDDINKLTTKTNLIPSNSELFDFFRVTETNNDLFLAVYGTDNNENQDTTLNNLFKYDKKDIGLKSTMYEGQHLGSAVFKKGKMIGVLSGEETMLATILNNNLRKNKDMFKNFPDPFNNKFTITTKINTNSKIKIDIKLDKEFPTIDVEVPLTIDVLTNHSLIKYFYKQKDLNKLEKHFEDELNKEYATLIKKTQEEFKGQPFGWSLFARKKFLTIDDFENFNWMERYPEMVVNVNTVVKLGNFGRQSEITNLKRLRDNDGDL